MTLDDYIAEEVLWVRDLIQSTFSSIPRPSRVTKRVAIALDDKWYPNGKRCQELYALDLEQRWHDLTDAEIEEFCSILPWLDDEGFRFYLPAFMDYALRYYPWEDSRAISDLHDLSWCSPKLLRALSTEQFEVYVQFENIYGHTVTP